MRFYVIEYDNVETTFSDDYRQVYTKVIGRIFYTSSNAKTVDPSKVEYAKLFPTERSVKQALQWSGPNSKIFEVETSVNIVGEATF